MYYVLKFDFASPWQAGEIWGNQLQPLLLLRLWETQCRNRSFSPGQVGNQVHFFFFPGNQNTAWVWVKWWTKWPHNEYTLCNCIFFSPSFPLWFFSSCLSLCLSHFIFVLIWHFLPPSLQDFGLQESPSSDWQTGGCGQGDQRRHHWPQAGPNLFHLPWYRSHNFPLLIYPA